MNKLIWMIFLFVICLNANAQNLTNVYFGECNAKRYLIYFDSVHQKNKHIIQELGNSYFCYLKITLNHTTNGVVKFEIVEDDLTPLCQEVKDYLEFLAEIIFGKWPTKDENSFEGMPKNIYLSILLAKSNESIREKVSDLDNLFPFSLKISNQVKGENNSFLCDDRISLEY